jgi:serine protease Do
MTSCSRFVVLFTLMTSLLSQSNNVFAFDDNKLLGSYFTIVMIRGNNDDGSMAFGSGVIIEDKKVLTNCHIFRQTKDMWISRGEDTFPINGIQVDASHDLCLLTSETLPFAPAKLGRSNEIKKGSEVLAIGHSSAAVAPVTSVGSVRARYAVDGGNIIKTNARFAMGASGSGLFDSEGFLIGINTFKTPGKEAYFYALPIEWAEHVKKMPITHDLRVEQTAFWEVDDAKKPFFMKVAMPEIEKNWKSLFNVADQWVKETPNNTEAWYELGLAEENLQQSTEAETSYRKALSLDPDNLDALFKLGLIASHKGNQPEVDAILASIEKLNTEVAQELSSMVHCPKEC